MHKREMIKLYKFTIKIREYEENVKLQKENSYNLHKVCEDRDMAFLTYREQILV